MKKKINRIIGMIALMLLSNKNISNAETHDFGNPLKIKEAVDKITPDSKEMFMPLLIIIIFFSVISIGINIILKRNNAEERSSAMKGLLYICIGAIILSSARLIYNLIISIIE